MSSTHDWSTRANADHVLAIQRDLKQFSEGGVLHLVLEVIAYAVDEAIEGTTNHVCVTLHNDRSICVEDNGRGTAIREVEGMTMVKPIMATPDLRFFGVADAPLLPDARVRSGMSVVAAMSEWLTHTNRRSGSAWTQRYEFGLPVGPLTEVGGNEGTGTSVCFRPNAAVFGSEMVSAQALRVLTDKFDEVAYIEIVDAQPKS